MKQKQNQESGPCLWYAQDPQLDALQETCLSPLLTLHVQKP